MAPYLSSKVGVGYSEDATHKLSTTPSRLFRIHEPPPLAELEEICSQQLEQSSCPLASGINSNIPIYDLSQFTLYDDNTIDSLQDEWNHVLLSGPGVLVLRNFEPNTELISHVNDIFASVIASEQQSVLSKGDHFAASGNNCRIWNSFQKHATADPSSFVQYYSNPWLALISEAWLGPAYRITAQVNIVRPRGKPQLAHRDYHLGFQTADSSAAFPKTLHKASQYLTLQGAVAHSPMPLECGPTRFLPFSQRLVAGYMAYRLPDFQGYFQANWVSLPLEVGDAVFFNPALFHAAGENKTSNVERSANLLQISSAFSKPMESVDTLEIILRSWEHLQAMYKKSGANMTREVRAVLLAIAEGYPFPTNLDRRPPAVGGMAPESEVDVVGRALLEGWAQEKLVHTLQKIRADSLSF